MATPLEFYCVKTRQSFVTTDWKTQTAKNGRLMAVTFRNGQKCVRFIG